MFFVVGVFGIVAVVAVALFVVVAAVVFFLDLLLLCCYFVVVVVDGGVVALIAAAAAVAAVAVLLLLRPLLFRNLEHNFSVCCCFFQGWMDSVARNLSNQHYCHYLLLAVACVHFVGYSFFFYSQTI